jgi:thiol-disulfide isomerase/thioredoxin
MTGTRRQRPTTARTWIAGAMLMFGAAACAAATAPKIVTDIRALIAHGDLAGAAAAMQHEYQLHGVTPEGLEAESWIARALLAAGNTDTAEKFAQQTYQLSSTELKKHPLGHDPNAPLALALGASIEVQGGVMVRRGQRADAVVYLKGELEKFRATPIRTRIQKNILLLSLEGKPAPPLLGAALPKGKPALLFFWAHWCPDCKAEAAILKRLLAEFQSKGLVFLAPTQRYGYVANGEDAPPAAETRYIEQVREKYYAGLIRKPLLVNAANFRNYGASTTPTLVLVDRRGIVRLYHPGAMTYEDLRARIAALL